MEIFNIQEALEDEGNFAEQGTLHCLDALYSTEKPLEPLIKHQIVLETELEEWMKGPPCTFKSNVRAPGSTPNLRGPSLRLIALENPKRIEMVAQSQEPLTIDRQIYRTIATRFEISSMFLAAALNQEAIFLRHHQQRPEQTDACIQYVFGTYATQKGHFCLGLTYRPSETRTTAFISGLRKEEIQRLFALIKIQKMHLASPMLIPTLLAGFRVHYVRIRLFHCHKIADAVKDKIGLANNIIKPSFSEPSITDSVELSQSLTTIFSKLAKYAQHCGILLDFCRAVDEESQSCLEATLESHKEMVEEATAFVRTSVSYMASSARSSKNWTEFLRQRAQGYIQIVNSFIAQRDSLLSIKLAESSLQISEATRSDNLAMKAIAENSRIIAEESKIVAVESLRKNDAMRSIAFVTMLFLPPTFIATLFSTSFFDFQALDGGPNVSRWIWLYVLVTLVVTAMIQGLWFLNARRRTIDPFNI